MIGSAAQRDRSDAKLRMSPLLIERSKLALACIAAAALFEAGAFAANEAGEGRGFTTADVKRGSILFLQCRACHATNAEDGHRVGPNLSSLFGSVAGSRDGFVYSESMGASDVVWDEQTLFEFLGDPDAYFNGTKMAYAGLPNEADRRRLIEYLRQATKD